MSVEQEGVTITVRLIKSFPHRNIKHLIYKDVQLTQTVGDFIKFLLEDVKSKTDIPPPFKKHPYDTLKISHQPFGAKTTDPVINRDNDEDLILCVDKTLAMSKIVNETELSFFNLEEYRTYQANPSLVWE